MENTLNTNFTVAVATLTSCAALVAKMKSRAAAWAIAMTSFAALAGSLPLSEQDGHGRQHEHHRYKLIDLGTFGGSSSIFNNPSYRVLNNHGTAVGFADTAIPDPYFPDCFYLCQVDHGFAWKNGVTTDLGTLPGGVSSAANAINNIGMITGVSQNGLIDPLTGFPEARAVIWRNGGIVDLGTLGGTQSGNSAINDLGQVVGGALTAIPDPYANAPLVACWVLPTNLPPCSGFTFAVDSLYVPGTTAMHAFVWHNGMMLDLGTLGGPDSNAWVNNEYGQVAGWSDTSFVANPSTGVPTVDPFIWSPEDGKMVDLGGLGGTFGAPFFMNNRGQVTGVSNLAGDQTYHAFRWNKEEGMQDLGTLKGYSSTSQANWINDAGEIVGESDSQTASHAFLWREGVMTDLGTVANDACSTALAINSHGQIVGWGSADCFHEDHAFLWENGGPIVDLSTLLLPGSGVTLIEALFINDQGEIAGVGKLPNGDDHAVVLLPCDENHVDVVGCD
jgi:probable HAF family extracellular repeat protein